MNASANIVRTVVAFGVIVSPLYCQEQHVLTNLELKSKASALFMAARAASLRYAEEESRSSRDSVKSIVRTEDADERAGLVAQSANRQKQLLISETALFNKFRTEARALAPLLIARSKQSDDAKTLELEFVDHRSLMWIALYIKALGDLVPLPAQ